MDNANKMSFLENYALQGERLPILTYPDKRLTTVSKELPLEELQGEKGEVIAKLAKDMLYTMYHAPGIGLAAPQIGQNIRLFVVDTEFEMAKVMSPQGKEEIEFSNFSPMVFINPKITVSEDLSLYQEGCLSLPDTYEEVERPSSVTVEYYDLNGEKQSLTTDGLTATCIQHENDHLNGIVFIDHLSMLKKNLLKKKLTKLKLKNKK